MPNEKYWRRIVWNMSAQQFAVFQFQKSRIIFLCNLSVKRRN